MKLPEELRTDRLRLRPFRADDAGEVFRRWASRVEATRWLTWERHGRVEQAADFIQSVRADRASGAGAHWLIEQAGSGEPLGAVGLQTLSSFSAELGYVLAPEAWGRGVATEAVRAVTAAAFAGGELERLQAHCHPDNAASLRVLEKCGYEREGRLRRCRVLPNLADEPQDLVLLARLKPSPS